MLNKYSTTMSLGRHRYQTTIGIKPVNYQDGNIWKHIINNWTDSGIVNKPHMVITAPFMVNVTPNGGRRIHPTREQDVWFEISGAKINQAGSWNIVQLGTPTSRIDNRITWNRTNFNAYMDMGGHFIKLGYLLKDGFLPPNNQFAFEVATQGLTRSGCVFYKDGIPVMHLRKPIAYDHDNPDDVRQIAHEITRIDNKWHAVFTLPSFAGMSNPVIDPTLELQPDAAAGLDGKTASGAAADNNYGVSDRWDIGLEGTIIRRFFIKFDLSTLPDASVISSTTLSLYFINDEADTASTYEVFRSKRVWLEGTQNGADNNDGVTWNEYDGQNVWSTAGGFGANDCEQTRIGHKAIGAAEALNEFKDFTIVATSKTDLDYGLEQSGSATGFMIKSDDEGNQTAYHGNTSDHATVANRPKLMSFYTEGKKDTTPQFFPILFDKKKH